jgi:hypothetical protein
MRGFGKAACTRPKFAALRKPTVACGTCVRYARRQGSAKWRKEGPWTDGPFCLTEHRPDGSVSGRPRGLYFYSVGGMKGQPATESMSSSLAPTSASVQGAGSATHPSAVPGIRLAPSMVTSTSRPSYPSPRRPPGCRGTTGQRVACSQPISSLVARS